MQWTVDKTAPRSYQDLTPNSDAARLRLDTPTYKLFLLCYKLQAMYLKLY
jgi:hypothetical protein